MIPRSYAEDILRDIGERDDASIDLAEGALALAALDRPGVAPDRYRDHIEKLADDVGDALAAGNDLAAALNAVVLDAHGYHGDTLTYDDIQNANLMRVIDRKKGLPVALGILFLQAARANGYAADGLNFPGHFLIRLGDGRDRIIVDPFNDGIERSAADLRELLKVTAGLEAELTPQHYEA
ncbi:MAG: transglutaminase family protein, partial [Alphaproteobacteria bacterium]